MQMMCIHTSAEQAVEKALLFYKEANRAVAQLQLPHIHNNTNNTDSATYFVGTC